VFYIGRAKSVNTTGTPASRVGKGEWGIDNLVLRVVAILIIRTRWLMLWVQVLSGSDEPNREAAPCGHQWWLTP
jgi:hypothetical protein